MSNTNRFDIDPEAWDKFDNRLKQKISEIKADRSMELSVMIVLSDFNRFINVSEDSVKREDRKQRVKNLQTAFERDNAELVRILEQWGARDLQLHWINNTISGKLTLPVMEVASKFKEVAQIMLLIRQKVITTLTHRKENKKNARNN